MRRLANGLIAVLLALPVHAVTIQVPTGQPTIQAGVDAAAAGDTVLVACGTYLENDIVMKSGVTLRSASGQPDCVTIDAQQQGRVVYCESVDGTTLIEGLTFTRGQTSEPGAGMYCTASSPTVSHCEFFDNSAFFQGGGVGCWDSSSPSFTHCTFTASAVRSAPTNRPFRSPAARSRATGVRARAARCTAGVRTSRSPTARSSATVPRTVAASTARKRRP